jgi:hypothetical protein
MIEQELTRLCFLVDALVRSPDKVENLTKNILEPDPPPLSSSDAWVSPELKEGVIALKEGFEKAFGPDRLPGRTSLQALKDIADQLLQRETEAVRIAGHALSRAIKNAS